MDIVLAKGDDELGALSRREALEKLVKLSAYAAPAVTALLTPTVSHATGSSIPQGDPVCNNSTGSHYEGALGANNNANVVGGDAPNGTGYNDPVNGWVPPGDGWGGNSDHGLFYSSFNQDTAADCGS